MKMKPHIQAAFDRWWEPLTRQGDPARRPSLIDEAFEAGYEAGIGGMVADLPEATRHHAMDALASVAQSIRKAYCWGLARGKDGDVSEPDKI